MSIYWKEHKHGSQPTVRPPQPFFMHLQTFDNRCTVVFTFTDANTNVVYGYLWNFWKVNLTIKIFHQLLHEIIQHILMVICIQIRIRSRKFCHINQSKSLQFTDIHQMATLWRFKFSCWHLMMLYARKQKQQVNLSNHMLTASTKKTVPIK